jgi:hypothetical protein
MFAEEALEEIKQWRRSAVSPQHQLDWRWVERSKSWGFSPRPNPCCVWPRISLFGQDSAHPDCQHAILQFKTGNLF